MAGSAGAQTRPTSPVLVGYVPAFKGLEATVARLPRDQYTHVNISFANPDASGRFLVGDRLSCMGDGAGGMVTRQALTDAVAAVRAQGSRVLVSVAGGVLPACSGDWPALLTPDNRAATIAELVGLADDFALDGIDVDIEWATLDAIDKAGNFTPFIAELSEALRARGKLLTCATASNPGGMIPDAAIPYFDLVNVMSYDVIGPSWGQAGAEHSSLATAERDLSVWLNKGVRPERLVLGVPFYGYGFNGFAPNWAFRDLSRQFGPAAERGDVIGQACAGCRYITFNTPATLARKADLARSKAGGIMVWEISQDTDDHRLVRLLKEHLTPDRAARR